MEMGALWGKRGRALTFKFREVQHVTLFVSCLHVTCALFVRAELIYMPGTCMKIPERCGKVLKFQNMHICLNAPCMHI